MSILRNTSGIPFMYNKDDDTYSLDYHMIRYTMGVQSAQYLHDWHLTDPKSKVGLYPLVLKWYEQLTEDEKSKIIRYDHNLQTLIN